MFVEQNRQFWKVIWEAVAVKTRLTKVKFTWGELGATYVSVTNLQTGSTVEPSATDSRTLYGLPCVASFLVVIIAVFITPLFVNFNTWNYFAWCLLLTIVNGPVKGASCLWTCDSWDGLQLPWIRMSKRRWLDSQSGCDVHGYNNLLRSLCLRIKLGVHSVVQYGRLNP